MRSVKKLFILRLTILLFFIPAWSIAQEKSVAEKIKINAFNTSTLLWYEQPAKEWDQALPLGNGRLGAMVYGGSSEETIQLNEETLWSGGPYNAVVKDGYKKLPEIQHLVFDGQMLKAHNLFGRYLMGYPVEQQKYQPLGNLVFNFPQKKSTDYKRWLDLETGIAGVEYSADNIVYTREVFVSAPDNVIAIRLAASKKGSLSFKVQLRGHRNQAHSNYGTDYFQMNNLGGNGLQLTGKSADYLGVKGQLRYDARLQAFPTGGSMQIDDATLTIDNADEVILYVAAATNFVNYQDVSADEHGRTAQYLKPLAARSYDEIKQRHLAYYQPVFQRSLLKLPETNASFLPTDQRLQKNVDSSDPQLAALAYHFGRYVLICSSRPGTQAANLQGIWNNDSNPAWDSKYTTNINLQMNYFGVESANLQEYASPLIELTKELMDQGSQVAKEHYGARGWVCHQNTDIWRAVAPMDGPTWGTFTTGGAWLTTQLWQHYLFNKDSAYLKEVYPVLKGSVEFFMDFLVKHPNKKWLVTNPSTSPENFPAYAGNGPYFDEVTGSILPGTTICAGSTIDMQILHDLFGDFLEATSVLGVDKNFAQKVAEARSILVPPQIGKDSLLQEWTEDWGQLEKNHRHASHMYGLYPGNVLSPEKTPQFLDACKRVLNNRGDGSTGWSRAWKVALWARLMDGNRANKILKGYFREQTCQQLFARCGKPMQVDGTLGVMAGITEMLLQSHEGYLHFLPALPAEWNDGTFKGVCARGAFELTLTWKNQRLLMAEMQSKQGEPCNIPGGYSVTIKGNNKKVKLLKTRSNTMQFSTAKGVTYLIRPI